MFITDKIKEELMVIVSSKIITENQVITILKTTFNKLKISLRNDVTPFVKVDGNSYATNFLIVYQEKVIMIYLLLYGKRGKKGFNSISKISLDYEILN